MSQLEAGRAIVVYEDPHTREKVEGEATLIARRSHVPGPGGLEYWGVQFTGERTPFGRWVHPENIIYGDSRP